MLPFEGNLRQSKNARHCATPTVILLLSNGFECRVTKHKRLQSPIHYQWSRSRVSLDITVDVFLCFLVLEELFKWTHID